MAVCGILALQGDWEAHAGVVSGLGAVARAVRTADDLAAVDALVLPGGESTAIIRLMEPEALAPRIVDRVRDGMPVLGTCAGLILMAVSVDPPLSTFALLDVDVKRNAYGRQVASSVVWVDVGRELGQPSRMRGAFIRAPRVTRVGSRVEVLARRGSDPVLVRHNSLLASSFHPELTDDRRVHRLFLSSVEEHNG